MTHVATRHALRGHKKRLLSKSNVVSVGVGFKEIGGQRTDELCVVVGVTKKIPRKHLIPSDVIPDTVEGCKTDVIELGIIRAQEQTGRLRPAPGGISIGHKDITAGTLGCLVTKNGETLILSNNHVLANSNDANIGDPILQPGPVDGGSLDSDRIGILESFIPLNFGGFWFSQKKEGGILKALSSLFENCCFCRKPPDNPPGPPVPDVNRIDAALALPDFPDLVTAEILGIGSPIGWAQVSLNESVKKSGRTTDVTQDIILQMDATVRVQYGGLRVATFEDQIIAGPMSAGGDSGSAVLNMNNEVVGLLFAGSDTVTIINPIEFVFEDLGVEILV